MIVRIPSVLAAAGDSEFFKYKDDLTASKRILASRTHCPHW
jgi:hypothetical protein